VIRSMPKIYGSRSGQAWLSDQILCCSERIAVSPSQIRSAVSDDDTDTDDGDHNLKERCQSAAYRARHVHEWLAPLLKDSAAAKHAYAFKDRVKSADDIYKKVLARISHTK